MAIEKVLMPMVGKVLSVDVKVGDAVDADQQLGTFESMKMEMPLFAPAAGKIVDVQAKVGDVIDTDGPFCDIEI